MFKDWSYKNFSECIKNLIDLCDYLILKNKYPDEDIRTVCFSNVRHICYSSISLTNLLDSWVVGDDLIRSIIPQILWLQDVNKKNVDILWNDIAHNNKLSLVILSQFQIEHLITSLWVTKKIFLEWSKDGFYLKSKKMIKYLSLDNWYLDFLNVPGLIRNSLHSNGIHYWPDLNVEIDSINYNFKHGKKVSCASMAHITHALEKSIKILDEIINHRKIKEHNQTIFDKYWQQTFNSM